MDLKYIKGSKFEDKTDTYISDVKKGRSAQRRKMRTPHSDEL